MYYNVPKICKSIALMHTLGETFTAKEFEKVNPKDRTCSTLETLRHMGIVQIAEKETFKVRLKKPIKQYEIKCGIYHPTLLAICPNEYRAEELMRYFASKKNSVFIEEKEIWEIEGVRHHYKVGEDTFHNWVDRWQKDIEYAIKKKQEKIEVENRRLLDLMNAYQMIS